MAREFFEAQQRIGKGNPAPEILAVNLDGRPQALSDLKGKFVVIDVWATWCGPCRQESPHFEAAAIKRKGQDVVFVALSVDEDPRKWLVQAKAKSKSVQQWHIVDNKGFSGTYSLESIPRFIFIGPDGRFISSRMTRPSDEAFNLLIDQAMEKEGKLRQIKVF